MPLTRSFRETVQARAQRDIKFRQALLGEAMQALLDGDLEEGRAALRSCINATVGFEKLGTALGRSPKSLMRMFGSSGNPTAENLLAVIGVLQAKTGVRLQVRAVSARGLTGRTLLGVPRRGIPCPRHQASDFAFAPKKQIPVPI